MRNANYGTLPIKIEINPDGLVMQTASRAHEDAEGIGDPPTFTDYFAHIVLVHQHHVGDILLADRFPNHDVFGVAYQ
jgi:hypothetical protein